MVKNPPAGAGNVVSTPEVERSPGGRSSHPHQYSCLDNRMDRRYWWYTVHGVRVGHSWATEHTHISVIYTLDVKSLGYGSHSDLSTYNCKFKLGTVSNNLF